MELLVESVLAELGVSGHPEEERLQARRPIQRLSAVRLRGQLVSRMKLVIGVRTLTNVQGNRQWG